MSSYREPCEDCTYLVEENNGELVYDDYSRKWIVNFIVGLELIGKKDTTSLNGLSERK